MEEKNNFVLNVICHSRGKPEEVEITEEDIQRRFQQMIDAYDKTHREGNWSDYGDCNRAIDNEIIRRIKNV